MNVDPERVAALLREVAEEEVLPRFRALADEEIMRKKAGDLVTVADLAVERALERRLPPLLPGSLVLGEEAAEHDPQLFERVAGEETVWIVDPIDGTGNFARGVATFAVMVALTRAGALLGGWILDPVVGRMAVAVAGEGAWLDGRRLRVETGRPLAALRGTLHAGFFGSPELARRVERGRAGLSVLKSLRCAGHEYLRLVTGESDFTLFTKTKPWDHCAGVLLHAEAGGVGRLLDGRPYGARHHSEEGLMMAPDPEAWQTLHHRLLA